MSHSSNQSGTLLQAVRKRPPLYVGSWGQFGFINYVVSAVNLTLATGATTILIEVDDEVITVKGDGQIRVHQNEEGLWIPFEQTPPEGPSTDKPQDRPLYDAIILTALSEHFDAIVSNGTEIIQLLFERGERISITENQQSDNTGSSSTTVKFRPDASLLSVTSIGFAPFDSYLRRISHLASIA